MPEPAAPDHGPSSVPDPRRAGQVPWPLYRLGALASALSVAAWWAAAQVDGPLHLVCVLLGVATGLYGLYLLLLSAGWQLLSSTFDTLTSRHRIRRARQSGAYLVDLRFGDEKDPEADFVSELARALDENLGPNAECGDASSSGGASTCHVMGTDLDRMIDGVRRVAEGFPLPADAYLWVPDLTRSGYGHVLPLHRRS